jgi:hypothetical protein
MVLKSPSKIILVCCGKHCRVILILFEISIDNLLSLDGMYIEAIKVCLPLMLIRIAVKWPDMLNISQTCDDILNDTIRAVPLPL